MVTKKNSNRRGKPQDWTDDQLKEMALEVKYKNQSKNLTPSFLQQETGVGRNTWTRRMKEFIEELNNPMLPTINLDETGEVTLPNIDLIFKKYGKDKQGLKNELLNVEVLIYDLYTELKQYKAKEELYQKAINDAQSLKEEVAKQKKRAEHYEQLYDSLAVSSVFPHLQKEKKSKLNELGIKDNLIDCNINREKSLDLGNLSSHFPKVTDATIANKEELEKNKKRDKNMKELLNKFDL
ncbi:hypothetical protein [Bacillus massiliglaciei]|uniref:hypothetical protein n=1 Tax=Bacillus massiliglaciei TaxID=1816693 RepID=UPI000AE5F8AF|nr:hypothetical protein [Bacillus massiliglaciei]